MRLARLVLLATVAMDPPATVPAADAPVAHIDGFAVDGVEPRAGDADAPFAQGWPAATAPGDLALKDYPAYRSAEARGPGRQPAAVDGLFFPLFLHITQSDVAMTSPVVITPPQPTAADPGEASMEFVYRKPDLGKPGQGVGIVRVVDHPPARFLCLGVQGTMDEAKTTRGVSVLHDWLDKHRDEWVAAGPPRRLGYHSPMTPEDRRLWEVQIPVTQPPAATVNPSATGQGWVNLDGLDAWRPKGAAWQVVGSIAPSSTNPRLLVGGPGRGILTNGPTGNLPNLLTKRDFGDVEIHAEFLIPPRSNSGIKLEGLYEIQIFDSFGKAPAKADDCGGIYPRAELLPSYHHIDDGIPPRLNACRPPGEWQTLDIRFRAPKFNAEGRKVAPARFERVELNGQVVQENVDVPTPTGHAWHDAERPAGPILLQGDHGPVGFRNLRARPLD